MLIKLFGSLLSLYLCLGHYYIFSLDLNKKKKRKLKILTSLTVDAEYEICKAVYRSLLRAENPKVVGSNPAPATNLSRGYSSYCNPIFFLKDDIRTIVGQIIISRSCYRKMATMGKKTNPASSLT
jgi:hypothetical protein